MGVLRAPPSKDNKDLLGVRTWALKVIESVIPANALRATNKGMR
jgi:hypothetical protein